MVATPEIGNVEAAAPRSHAHAAACKPCPWQRFRAVQGLIRAGGHPCLCRRLLGWQGPFAAEIPQE